MFWGLLGMNTQHFSRVNNEIIVLRRGAVEFYPHDLPWFFRIGLVGMRTAAVKKNTLLWIGLINWTVVFYNSFSVYYIQEEKWICLKSLCGRYTLDVKYPTSWTYSTDFSVSFETILVIFISFCEKLSSELCNVFTSFC